MHLSRVGQASALMTAPQKLRIRIPGCTDFETEFTSSTTVLEAKILATTGCDIDPQEMRFIHKGKILRDEDVLERCGVSDGGCVHVARGATCVPKAAPLPSTQACCQPTQNLNLTVKAPGCPEFVVQGLDGKDTIDSLRLTVAERCAMEVNMIHLLYKAKMLRDGCTLSDFGLVSGDVIRVARRQAEIVSQPAAPTEVPAEIQTDVEMPMAWGSNPLSAEALEGVPPEVAFEVERILQMQRPGRPRENQEEMQARFAREARDMAMEVIAYLRLHRAEDLRLRGGPRRAPQAVEDDDEDPELLADVTRMLAEARSRGAPVPRVGVFVERSLERRRQARMFESRLDREAGDMAPELADALAAAEVEANAKARMPRKLGHGPGRSDSTSDGNVS